jgi:alpha-ketoglutarate-dependent taurine dioxygenase
MTRNLSATETVTVEATTSYAKVFDSAPVKKAVAAYGGSESEQSILRELRAKGAVGVVVAVNGRVLWADVFASTELLSKYWPKLMRSYIAEAMTSENSGAKSDLHEAEIYMNNLTGGHEVVETEPEVFRRTEINGDGYRIFELTALLPKTGFSVHLTKIRE